MTKAIAGSKAKSTPDDRGLQAPQRLQLAAETQRRSTSPPRAARRASEAAGDQRRRAREPIDIGSVTRRRSTSTTASPPNPSV